MMIISRFIHVAADGTVSRFVAEYYSTACMNHIFLPTPLSVVSQVASVACCCELCCCEHWGARILWNHGFLQMVCMPFGASFLCRPPACRRCLVGACYKVRKAPYFMPITEILIPASRRPPLPHPLCFEFQALLYGYFLFL